MRINWQYGDSSILAKYAGKPVINNGLVYISAGNQQGYPTLYCINAQTGIEQWHYTSQNNGFGFTSSQIFNDNIYLLSKFGKLLSLNALTGDLNWEVGVENIFSSLRGSSSPPSSLPFSSLPIPLESSPIIINNIIYVGSNNGCLYLFEPNTGDNLGKIEICEQGIINTPVYVDEYNLICLEISDGSVCVIDLETQKVKWMYSNQENRPEFEQVQNYKELFPDILLTLFPPMSQWFNVASSGLKYMFNIGGIPIVSKGIVYSGGGRTNFVALDLESGTKIWEFCSTQELELQKLTSPAVSNNVVCFGNKNGTVWAANSDNGQILWSYETITTVNNFNFGSMFSPVISNDRVIIGGRGGYLRGLELQTGQQLWKFEAPNSETFSTQPMDLFTNAVNTIGKVFIDNCPSSQFYSPLVTDNSIYVVAENGSFKTFLSLSI